MPGKAEGGAVPPASRSCALRHSDLVMRLTSLSSRVAEVSVFRALNRGRAKDAFAILALACISLPSRPGQAAMGCFLRTIHPVVRLHRLRFRWHTDRLTADGAQAPCCVPELHCRSLGWPRSRAPGAARLLADARRRRGRHRLRTMARRKCQRCQGPSLLEHRPPIGLAILRALLWPAGPGPSLSLRAFVVRKAKQLALRPLRGPRLTRTSGEIGSCDGSSHSSFSASSLNSSGTERAASSATVP
jgi:hypothetical protein